MTSLPDARAVSPRQLVEIVDIGQPVVSPDGSRVAFRTEQASIERNTYDTVWYVQGMDGQSGALRVADGGVPLRNSAGTSLPAAAVWSPDGRWIYYRAALEGRIDVWRTATDGSRVEALTLDEADVREFSLSADGRVLHYSVGASRSDVVAAELAEYDRGVRIDARVPIGQGLFRSARTGPRPATQRYTGNWFDRDFLLSDVPDRWKAIELETGTRREAAEGRFPEPQMSADNPDDGHDPPWRAAEDRETGRVAVLVRFGDGQGLAQKPGVRLLVRPRGQSGLEIECASSFCIGQPISGILWRPGTEEVLFTVTDPDESQAQSIFGWHTGTGEVRLVVRSAGLLSGGRDAHSQCGVSTAVLACVVSEANLPPRLERIDLASGERAVLFSPNKAVADQHEAVLTGRLLRWTDPAGRTFSGRFIAARVEGEGPPPLFVTYYSCPGFLRGGVGDEWPLFALAMHGIAVLCINQHRDFPLDAVERYSVALSAVASAVDLLATLGEIDRARVGMGGLSFGSEVTLWVAMHSELLAAASVSSPVLSSTYFRMGRLKGDDFLSELERTWQVSSPGNPEARWGVLSPEANLERLRLPLLLQMAEQEYLYAIDYTIPLLLGRRADLYVFPDEPHQKFQPRHKLAVYQRNLDWFLFWLREVEDADPAKAGQYAHWKSMKAGTP